MIILFPQVKEWNTRSDCANEKANAENTPPTPSTLTHSTKPPPRTCLPQTPALPESLPPGEPSRPGRAVPEGLNDMCGGGHWPHRLCSPRGYNPQPASLFLPQAPSTLHILKYMINKHLELNHIFQLVKINFSYSPSVSSLPSLPKDPDQNKRRRLREGVSDTVICASEHGIN